MDGDLIIVDVGLDGNLAALLAFIRGRGPWRHFGGGIHTWPGGDDCQQKIYDACCELERLGLVTRKTIAADHVVFA